MENLFGYVVLGLIQGITEILPISSSAHLVIAQYFLGIKDNVVILDVMLHLGTLLAVIIFFFRDILDFLKDKRLVGLVIVSMIPTFMIAIFLDRFSETLFTNPGIAGVGLLVTGVLLLVSGKFLKSASRGYNASVANPSDSMISKNYGFNFKDSFFVGIIQGISVLPGISRSGSTICALLFRKINPEFAFKFSFIMSIPVIAGAVVLKSKDIILGNISKDILLGIFAATFVAFVAGCLSLWLISGIIKKGKFYLFGWYCLLVGVLTLIIVK